jgi:hypothetical protein
MANTRPMEDAEFSDPFCGFIQANIPSFEAAELLLTLVRQPDEALSAAQALSRMPAGGKLTPAEAARLLEGFQARGLLAGEPGQGYRYQPISEELRLHAETLARAYNERPVTLVRIIYALRDSRMRSFADAFKLRRS